ncbi:hypothetical protein HK405_000215, partial [Cladochytrium tenue]
GLAGFYRGFVPCFLRSFPTNGAAILVFESVTAAGRAVLSTSPPRWFVAARRAATTSSRARRRPAPSAPPPPPPPPAYAAAAPVAPPRPLLLLAAGYLALVNVGAAALFFHDKRQAERRAWRVPERTLQLSALLGGWAGGVWAMEKFRHKTAKKAFREPYFAAVAANVAISAGLVGAWAALPHLRSSITARLRTLPVPGLGTAR